MNINDPKFLPLFPHSGPHIPKWSTKPHAPIHLAEAFWESIANGTPWTMLFWVRERHHILEQLKSPYHEMWEQCWVPCKVRRMASLMFCGWAPKQLGLCPECVQPPHENIPFGFLSKPSVYMRAHEALTTLPFPPSLQSLPLFLPKTTLPPTPPMLSSQQRPCALHFM